MNRSVLKLGLLLVLAGCSSTPANAPRHLGGVAATDPAAVDAGATILEMGGNAVDAAVATALALVVVNPQAGNLGGGGFAVVRLGEQVTSLDFREVAPAAATADMYLDADGNPIPRASTLGPLSAGVPGSPAGYFELHSRFGRLPWQQVVEPAIRLAQAGLTISPRMHRMIGYRARDFRSFPETASHWLPGGQVPVTGTTLTMDALARTLIAYRDQGPAAVTTGTIAAAIAAASDRHGGILTTADLAAYRPAWREPVRFTAWGWQFASMSLPSSGGIIVGQVIEMLEHLGWSAIIDPALRHHILVEALRRAYADRFLLGDPRTTRASIAELMDPTWVRQRAESIDRTRASDSGDIGNIRDAFPVESDQTTHLSVVDGDGNLASITVTLNGPFGSALYVPEAGFFLNNEMDDFATVPGKPNMYGLVQGQANAVGPGKRMLSSMSPTVAWRDSHALALGSPGGSRIPVAVLQVLLGVVVDDLALRQAVDRPRLHHQWLPDEIWFEDGLAAADWLDRFRAFGHDPVPPRRYLGEVNAVDWQRGRISAAADPRAQGTTARVVTDRQAN